MKILVILLFLTGFGFCLADISNHQQQVKQSTDEFCTKHPELKNFIIENESLVYRRIIDELKLLLDKDCSMDTSSVIMVSLAIGGSLACIVGWCIASYTYRCYRYHECCFSSNEMEELLYEDV